MMSEYRRAFEPGGMFFFTLVTHQRRPIFLDPRARSCLREAFRLVQSQQPFEQSAAVLLADHLHCIWRLPEEDHDFSTRWACIKKAFTRLWLSVGGEEGMVSSSRANHRERGVWQRRFWEHTLRDERDLVTHMDYIHYNPVKHGLARCPHEWPYSTFRGYVKERIYEPDWQCLCNGQPVRPPDFGSIESLAME